MNATCTYKIFLSLIANFQDQISNSPISPLFHIHLLVNRFGEFDESKFVYTEYGEYRKLVKGSYTLTLQETSGMLKGSFPCCSCDSTTKPA